MGLRTPEINGASLADIAFLLLIFFLVTTTMDTDTGIYRRLPDYHDFKTDPPPISERNVLKVYINSQNKVGISGSEIDVLQLKDRVIEFILNPSNRATLSDKNVVDIPTLGAREVSKGVVSLTNDRMTSYSMYITVQDQLTQAFNEIREMKAQETWGKKVSELSEEQHEALRKLVPTSISEAEPRNVTQQKRGK